MNQTGKIVALMAGLLFIGGVTVFASKPKKVRTIKEALDLKYPNYVKHEIERESAGAYLLISKERIIIVYAEETLFSGVKMHELANVPNV